METPIQITFRHLKSSKAVASKIRERADWLEHFCQRIISCRVVVETPHKNHRKGNLFRICINIRVPGDELIVSRCPDAHDAYEDVYVTIHEAFDEARRVLDDYVRLRRVDVKRLDSPPRAFVVQLIQDNSAGYGFIRTEDGRDLYFHSKSVLNDKYDYLELGTEVRYAEEMGEEGPQASTIEVVGRRGRSAPEELSDVS